MEDVIVNVVNFIVGLLHLKVEMIAGIAGILLVISEGLASISALKSNSILQLIINIFKKLAGK